VQVDVVQVQDGFQVLVAEPKQKVDLTKYTENHTFGFDFAYGDESDNVGIYTQTTRPLVQFVLEGGMGTCFAFGQTGSGKTFTMLGAPEAGQPGLYLLAAHDVFAAVDKGDIFGGDVSVFVSMMEIYGDEVLFPHPFRPTTQGLSPPRPPCQRGVGLDRRAGVRRGRCWTCCRRPRRRSSRARTRARR
jgi:hypothetical protein